MTNEGVCLICNQPVDERCKDEVCRGCHKTLAFEDCESDKYANEIRAKAGLPPMPPLTGPAVFTAADDED